MFRALHRSKKIGKVENRKAYCVLHGSIGKHNLSARDVGTDRPLTKGSQPAQNKGPPHKRQSYACMNAGANDSRSRSTGESSCAPV
jgi:hypothetical protein